ncbi:MAG: DUF2975 domain-containing protein [Clostridia bacterium]|nr:DUF2975 domain-containing protein [Clostridia bacterium]
MEVLQQIFDGLSSLATKLPAIDVKAIFIIAVGAIALVGIIAGLTFLSSSACKMKRACQAIIKYLAKVDEVNDDNAEEFTSTCFGKKVPTALRDSWVEYLGVRFGYPSEIISESRVFDKEVKKVTNIRANIFIAIALIVTGVLAFWSLGTETFQTMGTILGIGLILAAVIYLILAIVARKEFSKAREAFYEMQDEIDAKVDFHVQKSFSTDASPLAEMTSLIDEIIARNTSKVVEMPTEEAPEEPEEAPAEETPEEVTAEEEPTEAPQEEVAEEPVEELSEEVEEEIEAPTATMTVNEPSEEGVGDWVAGQDEFTEDQNLESFEEVNIEDDIVMFGKKRREREAAAQAPVQEEKIYLESEIMEDDEPELEVALAPAPAPVEAPAPAPAPVVAPATNQEIVEEYEDLDEGDEDVKAPRLSKLPHLVDYALTLNMSRGNKIKMAQLMFQAYAVFKNSPENKPLVINCLAKVMKSLMEDRK